MHRNPGNNHQPRSGCGLALQDLELVSAEAVDPLDPALELSLLLFAQPLVVLIELGSTP
ncbi:hypothetical protein [Streptomyces sp. sk226]|uniref:hypothetical protein n=1 Tax=Streptomyces sp. sk226 TaxID=2034268 RepID=UPI00211D6FAA|nr:hypothetical protein [Streptomyces sp. sk226]